jgi:UDP-N-acetylglucosamine 2-epimerase
VQPERIVSYIGDLELLRQIRHLNDKVVIDAPPTKQSLWQSLSTSWLVNRIRYRGGLRAAVRYYLDYWWSEMPRLTNYVKAGETPCGYILFIAVYLNHAKTFLPIWRQLKRPYLVLASGPDTCQFLRQQQVAYRRLGHFVALANWRRYRSYNLHVRRQQQALVAGVGREIRYENIALLPFLQADLSRLLRHHLARLRLYTEVYLELFQHSRPSHVVVADDTTTQGRIAVLAAQSLRIPTLNIQHGAIADVQIYRYAIADRIAVWGEHDRDLLVRSGVPEEKIVITGQPRFDDLGRRANDTAELRLRLDVPASHRVLLWATTPFVPRLSYDFPGRNRRYLQALLDLLVREPSWSLVIKLHPRDQRAEYEAVLAEAEAGVRSRVRILREEDIQQLLPMADAMLAWNTSVIQEAVLAEKPIIGLNFFSFPEAIPSVSEGIALPARSSEELSQSLHRALANAESTSRAMAEARQKYIARHLKADERTATERIIELICSQAAA